MDTSYTAPFSFLYKNDGLGDFSAVSCALSTTRMHALMAVWGDIDQDGDADLFVVQAHPSTGSGPVQKANLLFRYDGSDTFTQITSGDVVSHSGCGWRNAAFGDYDNDQKLDLIVSGCSGTILYKNGGGTFTVATSTGLPAHNSNGDVKGSSGDYGNAFADVRTTDSNPHS